MTGHGGKNDMRDNGGLTVQALWLSLASLMSMSVGIVTSMVLSRLLDQTEYGTYRQVIYVYYTLLMVFFARFAQGLFLFPGKNASV